MTTPTTPYEQKIARVRAIIAEYNQQAAEHNKTAKDDEKIEPVNADTFFKNLRADGAINDGALTTLSWEDIREHGVKPRTLAKAIAEIFRAKAPAPDASTKGGSERDEDERVITAKKAERMTPRALLKAYDPTQKESAVADRLRHLSDDRPFIVFTDDLKVNVDASLTLLEELQDGEAPREVYKGEDDEEPREVYRVGVNPAASDLVNECPIHPGEALRKGDLCRVTNRSWEPVSQTLRELLFLAIQNGELRVSSVDDAHNVMDRATQANAESTLRSRYQRASVEHGRLKKNDQLPRLKVRKGTGVAQQQPPFGGSSRPGNTGVGSSAQQPTNTSAPSAVRVVRLRPGVKDDGPTMANLRRALKGVVTATEKLEQIRDEVGLAGRVDVSGAADNAWFRLLDEAKKHGAAKIEQILGIVLGEYPDAEAAIAPFLVMDAPTPPPVPSRNSHWTADKVEQLRDVLVELYDTRSAVVVVSDARLNESAIQMNGSGYQVWTNIVRQAEREERLDNLLAVARKGYPHNRKLNEHFPIIR